MRHNARVFVIYALQLLLIYIISGCQTPEQRDFTSPNLKDGIDIGPAARADFTPSDAVAQLTGAIFDRHVVEIRNDRFGIDPVATDFGIEGAKFESMTWSSRREVGVKNFQGNLNDFFFAVYASLAETNQTWYSGEFSWFDTKQNRTHKLKVTIERMHRPDLVAITVNDVFIQAKYNSKQFLLKDNSQPTSVLAKRAYIIKNRTLKPQGELMVQNLRTNTTDSPIGHQRIIERGESSH